MTRITDPHQWDRRRWPNFTPAEVQCRCCGKVDMDPRALDLLQSLRTRMGQPLIINSGYRCPAHNKAAGGATNSRHVAGGAFDVRLTGFSGPAIEHQARDVGFHGIGRYPSFIHVDARPAPATWGSWK